MLTIAVVCGAGIATSALIAQQVRDHLAGRSVPVEVVQSTVIDLLSPQFRADVVVATVDLPSTLGIPRVNGMPLLLGTNPALTYADLDRVLDELEGTDR